MNLFQKLAIPSHDSTYRTVSFGVATTPQELDSAYRLRYQVYAKKGYIDTNKYPRKLESDIYDVQKKVVHFIAVLDETVIGYIRIIQDAVLPTEKYFTFAEPKELQAIARVERAELGRFIIVPPNKEKSDYLPRGLIMLFILNTLAQYGTQNSIVGGYAFVKKSLETKLTKMKMPFIPISLYTEHYPKDGDLLNYFSQPLDPVIPLCYRTNDFLTYTSKIINKRLIFKKIGEGNYQLRLTLYTKFLRSLKII